MFMRFLLALVFIFGIVFSCSKDDDTKSTNYELVETLPNTLISTGGVILNGKIENIEGVFDYGFIITTFKGGTYDNIGRKEILKGGVNGKFSVKLTSGLEEAKKYYYNVVVYKQEGNIYGKEKLFVSNGSALPIVSEIIPNKACLNDTIKVRGRFFSENPEVYFGDIKGVILSKSDTVVETIVPYPNRDQLPVAPYKSIKIINSDNQERVSSLFSLHTPRIDSIVPHRITDSDTLKIYGAHFETHNASNLVYTKYGTATYHYDVIELKNNKIVVAPLGLRENKIKVALKSQLIEVSANLDVATPEITKISKSCLGFEEEFTVYGKNFFAHNDSWVDYRLGKAYLPLLYKSRDSLVFKLTYQSEYDGFKNNKFKINFFNEQQVELDKDICITDPWIKVNYSISPVREAHSHNDELYFIGSKGTWSEEHLLYKFNTQEKKFEEIVNARIPAKFLHYSGTLNAFNASKLYSYYFYSANEDKFFTSYDLITNEEVELADFPGEDRNFGFMATLGDNIYMGLGVKYPNIPMGDIWKYSISQDTWEKIVNDFPEIDSYETSKRNPLVFAIGDGIYIGSGQPVNRKNDLWFLDLSSNVVSRKSDILQPIGSVNMVFPLTLNEKVYYQIENDMLEYSSISDTWRIISSNNKTYRRAVFFNVGSTIFMAYDRYLYEFNSDYLN